jgi:hypothetical protein
MSVSLRRCLKDRTEGACRRLGGKEFHAAKFLQKKDDNSTLDALGGLLRYGDRDLDNTFEFIPTVGMNCQKISGGVDICLFIVVVIDRIRKAAALLFTFVTISAVK